MAQIFLHPFFHLVVFGIRSDAVKINKFKAGLKETLHGHIDPTGAKQPFIADQKNFFSPKSAGTPADLTEHPSAENDFRNLELIVLQSVVPIFFHYTPFVAYRIFATIPEIAHLFISNARAQYKTRFYVFCIFPTPAPYFFTFAAHYSPFVRTTTILGLFSTV